MTVLMVLRSTFLCELPGPVSEHFQTICEPDHFRTVLNHVRTVSDHFHTISNRFLIVSSHFPMVFGWFSCFKRPGLGLDPSQLPSQPEPPGPSPGLLIFFFRKIDFLQKRGPILELFSPVSRFFCLISLLLESKRSRPGIIGEWGPDRGKLGRGQHFIFCFVNLGLTAAWLALKADFSELIPTLERSFA